MAESLGREVREALEATKPPPPSVSWRSAVVIVLCVTLSSLIACAALWQWGSAKSDQVDQLSKQSACRSFIAAETDVKQGEFLADLGATQLITARALAAVGTSNRDELTSLVTQLVFTSDELEATLAAYLAQLDARARTLETCGS